MSNPNPLMWLLLLLMLSAAFLYTYHPRWRREVSTGGEGPVDNAELAERLQAMRSQMSGLMSAGAHKREGDRPYESLDEALARGHQPQCQARPIVVTQSAQTHQGIDCQEPVFATDDLQLREGSDLAQVLAQGHLVLGPHSRVRQWAHADKTLLLGEDSVASHLLSSGRGIALAAGCSFQRLQAPVIVMGRPMSRRRGDRSRQRAPLPEQPPLARATPLGAQGWRVEGDCHILAGHHFRGSLVVSGELHIGADAVLEGDVKARRGVVVGSRACVSGAVLSPEHIRIEDEAQVSGPVVGDALLQLGLNVRLGSLTAPTSVCAQSIRAEEGVIIHGTVRATQAGLVCAS
jgi:cytoskeletal protein CcmA (bactofilin family)